MQVGKQYVMKVEHNNIKQMGKLTNKSNGGGPGLNPRKT